MLKKLGVGVAAVLMATALACSTPAFASTRTMIVSSSSKTVGNSTTIVVSGGTATVTATNSCSSGVSGFLYQSIRLLFGGGVITTTQSTTCP